MVGRPGTKPEEPNKPSTKPEKLEQQLKIYAENYRKTTWWWVFWYRFLLVAAAFLSASAAVVINLNFLPEKPVEGQTTISRNDIAAILAASATIFTTLLGAIGFENNWRANRQARDRVKELQLDLLRENPNYEQIINGLQKIIESRLSDFPPREQGTLNAPDTDSSDAPDTNKSDIDKPI